MINIWYRSLIIIVSSVLWVWTDDLFVVGHYTEECLVISFMPVPEVQVHWKVQLCYYGAQNVQKMKKVQKVQSPELPS